MSAQRFWFEEVPEEEKYWFLVPFGTSLSMEEQGEDRARESGLNPQDVDDLRDIESDVQHASVFGWTEEEARTRREEVEERTRRLQAVGYGDSALNVPWWSEVFFWEYKTDLEYVRVPILYTEREQAEEEQRHLEEDEPRGYLQLVEQYGRADADDAFDNSVPYKALWIDQGHLLDKLEDSTFLCVMVDGVLKLRSDFMEELRRE